MNTACKRGKPVGSRKSGGRQKGTPNLVTREFRETVNALLRAFADRILVWFDSVANGDPACGRSPDPARALDLLAKLAEFAAPKLARIEHVDPHSQAMQPSAIEIVFVESPSRPPTANEYGDSRTGVHRLP
ncbi:hypothetical protein WKW80_03140 [Variovorax humicola]|uniref:Uncharacterized protein n=1 Tax=Variovorax humicola TaxID=1769758 RepID=A0ABU8VVJ8_9BURK